MAGGSISRPKGGRKGHGNCLRYSIFKNRSFIIELVGLTIRDDLTERYERDIELMQRMYLEAERQFIEFNIIVPYADNDNNVYSPRLVSLLQIIGSQIDGVLKILAGLLSKNLKISSNSGKPSFTDYTRALDRYGLLSAQKIQLKENKKLLAPFRFDANYTTEWRTALNATKHDLPEGAYIGRYGHVVNSLAALAILHEIAGAAKHDKFRPYILNSKNWPDNGLQMLEMGFVKDYDFCRQKSQVFTYAIWFTLLEPTPTE